MRVERGDLEGLVEEGLTIRAIATRLGVTSATVQRALRRYDLRTKRGGPRLQRSASARRSNVDEIIQDCPRHGPCSYVRRADGGYRCRRCASEAVTRRRKRIKRILVEEAGGKRAICGYARYAGALQFHHLDPPQKRFALAGAGLARSLETARAEAQKCALLCANCHAEVEAGVSRVP